MGMPKIKIQRYSTTGGTEDAPPVGKFWAGYVEPEDKTWILYLNAEGVPFFFGNRDPETGACMEPPITVRVNGLECVSQFSLGQEVRMEFNPTLAKFLLGTVSSVKFTEYGKVLYDVRFEVPDLSGETPGGSTIIENVDSVFLSSLAEGESEEACCERDYDKDGNCDRHPLSREARFPRYRVTEPEETDRVVSSSPFKTRANGGPMIVTGPEIATALPVRETQANFDLEKLAKIWPEKYGEMAAALREAVSERAGEGCSGLPDGR